ncbi:histone H2A-beta, sperm-like [Wyeomyia smithii]|uniref:histone H2A-beta, sperm-like n=1 Tax=Wyeomyia smithii TaxID=174621 RepID=UPI00246807A0|nr:histone H2A-beta, sperm-like [Wyeomyia smithii]
MAPKLKKAIPKSRRAGLTFPMGRTLTILEKGKYADRIDVGAGVYMAATLEYLVAEILELTRNAAKDNRKMRIIPRHIQLAVHNDDELGELLKKVFFCEGQGP